MTQHSATPQDSQELRFTIIDRSRKEGLKRITIAAFLAKKMTSVIKRQRLNLSERVLMKVVESDPRLATTEYWWQNAPTHCQLSGVPFQDVPLMRPSVERIDVAKPYTSQNIMVVLELFQGFNQYNTAAHIEPLVRAGVVPYTVLANRRKWEAV